mgnify:CR=1 FL=1
MSWLSGAVLLPLFGAALHPLLGWCIQEGTKRGVSLPVIVAVANLLTGLIFVSYLRPEGTWAISGKDWWAVGNGIFFFLGQWFSTHSVKRGDLAVHSSALGMKVVIVGFCSMMVGLEPSSWNLVTGVILATLAVFLVSGGSAEGWRTHRATVGLTMVACLSFGLNDFLTGWQSREIGPARWLILMMGTSGMISLGFLFHRRKEVRVLYRSPGVLVFLLGAGFLLGIQALTVNLAFSRYGQPTLSNVVYSSRGVMAVIFLYLIGRKFDPRFVRKQTIGAVLMVVALAVVLWT